MKSFKQSEIPASGARGEAAAAAGASLPVRSSQEQQEQHAGPGEDPSACRTRRGGDAGHGQRQPEVLYVIDTNVFIDIENGEKPELRRRLMREDLRLVTLNFLELCKTRLPSQVVMVAQPLRDFSKHGRRDKVKEIKDRLMKDETFLDKVGRSHKVGGVQALMEKEHIDLAEYVSVCLEAECCDGCFDFRNVSSNPFISDISKAVSSMKMNELKYVQVVNPKTMGCD